MAQEETKFNKTRERAGIENFVKGDEYSFITQNKQGAGDDVDVGYGEDSPIPTEPNYVILVPKLEGKLRVGKKFIKIDGRTINHVWEKFADKPRTNDTFYAMVGVLNGENIHEGVYSKDDVEYTELFQKLISYGYDPLSPLRNPKFRAKYEKEMGQAILRQLGLRNSSTDTIKRAVNAVARKARDFVKDYIHGGDKLPLEAETIRARESKKNAGLVEYQHGIDMPLSESGQLEDDIKTKVYSLKSAARKDYFERKKQAERNAKERARIRKKQTAAANEKGYDTSREYQEALRSKPSPTTESDAIRIAKNKHIKEVFANKEFQRWVLSNHPEAKKFSDIAEAARRGSVELWEILKRKGKAEL